VHIFALYSDAIPGIGPLTATALIAAIGNGEAFRKGRHFAAWVGLVPREHSTGGKQKLLGISKRGNCYLRKLFVQGARAVLQFRDKQSSGLRTWLAQLTSRTHHNVLVESPHSFSILTEASGVPNSATSSVTN
jgi:transposase